MITNLLVHPELCPILMVVTIQARWPNVCALSGELVVWRGLGVGSGAGRRVDRAVAASGGFLAASQGRLGGGRHPAQCRQASRRGRCRLVSQLRSQGVSPPAQVPSARAGRDWRDRWAKAEVDVWLESQGLSGQVRAEALDIGEFLALAHALRERWGELPRAAAGTARGHQRAPEPENEWEE